MSTPNYLKLVGLTHIRDSGHTTQIENNLKLYFDWVFLGAGGWFDALRNSNGGAYGGSFSTLRKVTDPSFTTGTVWEGARKDWVWESGVNYTDKQGSIHNPVQISGVYINGNFATSGYYVDYPNGRVVFTNRESGPVQVEHSFRQIQTLCASKNSWFNELHFGSFRIDDSQFSIVGSGHWDMLAHKRVQMPAVIVEVVPVRSFIPYELGNIANWSRQDVILHIFGETAWDRDHLIDILSPQQDHNFWLFDVNRVLESGAYPLDERGTKVNNLTYADLVSPTGYRWQNTRIIKSITQTITSPDPKLFRATVRWTLETLNGGF